MDVCVLGLLLCQHPRNGVFGFSPALFEGERVSHHVSPLLGPLKKYLLNHKTVLRGFVVCHLCFVLCWHVSLRL